MVMYDEKGRLWTVWLVDKKIVEMCKEEVEKKREEVKRRD